MLFKLNFVNFLEKTKTILNLWSCRGFSLIGKITIIKSLIIPRITYKAMMFPFLLPKTFLKQINTTSTIGVILTCNAKFLVYCCKGDCNRDVKLLDFS